jgi:hypothetical protein
MDHAILPRVRARTPYLTAFELLPLSLILGLYPPPVPSLDYVELDALRRGRGRLDQGHTTTLSTTIFYANRLLTPDPKIGTRI